MCVRAVHIVARCVYQTELGACLFAGPEAAAAAKRKTGGVEGSGSALSLRTHTTWHSIHTAPSQ